MNRILVGLILFFIASCTCAEVKVSRPEFSSTVTIGIADGFNPEFWPQVLGPTLEYLRETLPHLNIKTKEVDIRHAESLRDSQVDLFIAPPLTFWTELLERGASAIGMLATSQSSEPRSSTAGVLITKSTRTDLKSERVLVNKKIAVRSIGFDLEYLLIDHWLREKGIKLEDSVIVQETGFRNPGVLSAVLSEETDFGLLAYCELEKAVENGVLGASDVKVISQAKDDNEICSRTTDLFPNIIVGAYPNTASEKAAAIAAALYRMPVLAGAYRWSYANGFDSLDEVARGLALGPYQYLQEWRPKALWKRFATEILLFIGLVFGLTCHIFRVNLLVARRTRELSMALIEKQKLSEKEKESREKLSSLEKAGLISHISSLIAYELKQPLGAITNYTAGLKAHISAGKPDPKLLVQVLDKISEQSQEASSVIDFVRSFAKPSSRMDMASVQCDPEMVVKKAVETLRLNGNFQGTIKTEISHTLPCSADAKGLELALYNVLKNAAEACGQSPKPHITVSVKETREHVVFSVADNGPFITNEDIMRVRQTKVSTKETGLGLGLHIVENIVENSGGHIDFQRNQPSGLKVTFQIPK